MQAPMTQALPQSTSHKNVRVVRMEPDVKSSKTCKLFNAGVSASAQIGKSADPTCYNAVTVKERTGLFENVERDMKPLWKKGDVVNIFQLSWSTGLLLEGRATVVKPLSRSNEHYMVRFHRKDGKLEREIYERFIDREGQDDPSAYIIEFNKRIGYAA